jgi:hypothetical protein
MKTQNKYLNETTMNIITDEILEELSPESFHNRSNEEWIKALESRLELKRRDFACMLDHAAEREELLSECHVCRREIEETKRRLTWHVMMRESRN